MEEELSHSSKSGGSTSNYALINSRVINPDEEEPAVSVRNVTARLGK